MQTVIIIQGQGCLKSYLKKNSIYKTKKCKYISYTQINSQTAQLFKKEKIEEIVRSKKSEDYKEQFIVEYVNLIGTIGKNYNTKEWWASNIACKNRFTSQLSCLLHQFLDTAEAIKKKDFDYLFIINPSWVIISSLKDLAKSSIVNLICLNAFSKKWLHLVFVYFRKVAGVFYHIIRIYGRVCYVRIKLKKIPLKVKKQYYVIKTFIYNHSFKKNGRYQDIFFGSLPEFLKDKKNILIYACILGDYRKCIKNIKRCHNYIIVPIEFFLSLKNILTAAVEILFCKIRIEKDVFFFGYNVKEIINNEFLRTFNGIQFYQFLHYWSAKNLFKAVSVETFLLTYENNPWERMCEIAAKEHAPNTKIIGYQHTVVPQAAVNMFIGLQEADVAPLPDKILTTGQETKRIMEKFGSYNKNVIAPACGLRFEYLFNIPVLKRKHSGRILLALEGVEEVHRMVDYVIEELKEKRDYQVTIRTHPMLPWKYFKRKFGYNLAKISNFTISAEMSLKDDIEASDMVIYWGTTVALEALSMGRPVIHFDNGSLLSYDPLFKCNDLKWTVSKRESLVAKIEKIYKLSDEDFYAQRTSAQVYLKRYFYPITDNNLKEFII